MKRETEQAMVFLDTHGSTTYPPKRWRGYRWAERDYIPDWLASEHGLSGDEGITVLANLFGDPGPKSEPGFKCLGSYQCGERECPWCGPGTDNESERADCKLCEGDGVIYWGKNGSWSFTCHVAPERDCAKRANARRLRINL